MLGVSVDAANLIEIRLGKLKLVSRLIGEGG